MFRLERVINIVYNKSTRCPSGSRKPLNNLENCITWSLFCGNNSWWKGKDVTCHPPSTVERSQAPGHQRLLVPTPSQWPPSYSAGRMKLYSCFLCLRLKKKHRVRDRPGWEQRSNWGANRSRGTRRCQCIVRVLLGRLYWRDAETGRLWWIRWSLDCGVIRLWCGHGESHWVDVCS